MTLLIAFAMDQDLIIPDIFFQNGADLGVAGTGVEGDGQNQLVSSGQVVGEVKGIEQGMDFLVGEGFNEYLALTLPIDSGGGVSANVFFVLGELEESPETFQDAVDVAGGQLLLDEILQVFLDVGRTDLLQFSDLQVLLKVREEEGCVVIVPLCGSGTEPSQLAFHVEGSKKVYFDGLKRNSAIDLLDAC